MSSSHHPGYGLAIDGYPYDDGDDDVIEVEESWSKPTLSNYISGHENDPSDDERNNDEESDDDEYVDNSPSTTLGPKLDNDNFGDNDDSTDDESCQHSTTIKTNGITYCNECGLQLKESLVEVEQRCYDYTTPTRHHARKMEGRNIYADLEKHHLPTPIVELANVYYTQMIDGQIFRAKTRTSIVFACVFNAFKMLNEPRSPEDLGRLFCLNKKGIINGLKRFSSFFRTTLPLKHITALDLMPRLLADLNIEDPTVYEDLATLYQYANGASKLYRSSNPQTVAAGLLRYYLHLVGIEVPKSKFSEVVGLTDITYAKLADETERVLATNQC